MLTAAGTDMLFLSFQLCAVQLYVSCVQCSYMQDPHAGDPCKAATSRIPS
jgi:hypothetical protein